MLNPKELLDIFTGRTPIESFARRDIKITDSLITFAVVFCGVAVLLAGEYFLFRGASLLLSKADLQASIIELLIIAFGSLVLIPVGFVFHVVFAYAWGAFHWFIATKLAKSHEKLNDFNASVIALFASARLMQGLVFLVPVVGWIAAALFQVYSVVLMFKFVKARFSLSNAQSAIVIFIPLNIIMLFLLLVSIIGSVAILGPRFLVSA